MTSIYSQTDYRAYIREQHEATGQRRGYLAELARAMGCHRSVIPQVLAGRVHLTPDQAAELARFWRLGALETEYFLDLVALERATSLHLKSVITRRLAALRDQGLSLKRSVPPSTHQAGREIDAGYYATWLMGAVHILIGAVPGDQVEALAQRLNLSEQRIVAALSELERMGLIVRGTDGVWRDLGKSLHLSGESPMHAVNCTNWRMRAIGSLDRRKSTDVHYTGLHGLSYACRDEVRVLLHEFLATIHAKIAAAPMEEGICLTIDLFDI